jgi:ubiquinone/menaquinone biosynthesis C-methylase UbiE
VICTDTDPIAATDIQRAASHLSQLPGSVEFRLCGDRLPFDDGEVDALFCVSVLEHIPGPEKTIREIRRILKPGGLLVLTIDLDLRGDSEIGPAPYRTLLCELEADFEFLLPDKTVHPADMLTSSKGPYPVSKRGGWRWSTREAIRRMMGKEPCRQVPFELAVMGFVLVSRT